MLQTATNPWTDRKALIGRFAPGLPQLLHYRREWLRDDVVAGISVAAVAVPTAIAYAQLIGFDPIVGLYAAILPLVAYALFGTSRQLIVNPDAATCAVFAASVLPLAAGDHQALRSLSIALAVLTGLVCIAAGLFKFGFVADFLGKPILVGYLNGVAISIFLGQLGKVFGFSMHSRGIVPRFIELAEKLPHTHPPTLTVGLTTFAVILAGKHWWPRAPAPLLAMLVAGALVYGLDLEVGGVSVVGLLPSGLPGLTFPEFDPELLKPLLGGALGVALVSFSSGMVTARSFAARNHYEVDVDQEFIALGACQIASGVSQGFAVAGADSRTAVNDAMGGKTQMVGVVAAVTMVAVLFFTEPLRYLPVAALGAVLIVAAIGLFDVRALQNMWRVNRAECALSVVTTFGVIWLDLLQGILMAVVAALLLLIKRASDERVACSGTPRRRRHSSWPAGLSVWLGNRIFQCRVLQEPSHGNCRRSSRRPVAHCGWKHDQSGRCHWCRNARITDERIGCKEHPLRSGERTPRSTHYTGACRRAQAHRPRIHVSDP